jgi:uncharacterized peroxidase-related enzyme
VANIVKAQGQRPLCAVAFLEAYKACMFGECSLPLEEREMIAAVVSRANRSHYSVEAHGEELRRLTGNDALVEQLKKDYTQAPISPRLRAILDYAVKLTMAPSSMAATDIVTLRAHGLGEEAILDIVEIVGFFNMANRIAEALNVDIEEGMEPYPVFSLRSAASEIPGDSGRGPW